MPGRHRPRAAAHPAREVVSAALWVLLMLVWLGGLLLGLWQAWPSLRVGTLDLELAAAGMWLVIGFAAWLVALNFGWQRYRRR